MKFFTNKKFLFKLIISLCICLTITNICTVPIAQADSGELVSKAGGVILDPLCHLLLALGDGIMEIIQKSTMGTSATAIFDTGEGGGWWKVLSRAIAIALIIVIGIWAAATGGLGALIISIAKFAVKFAVVGAIAHVVTLGGSTVAISNAVATYFGENVVLPTFTIGPEEIFSGEVLLFDPNIFDPETVWVELKAPGDEDSGNYVIELITDSFGTTSTINVYGNKMTESDILELPNGFGWKEYKKENIASGGQTFTTGKFKWNGSEYNWDPMNYWGVNHINASITGGTTGEKITLEEWNYKEENADGVEEYANEKRKSGYIVKKYFYYDEEGKEVPTSINNAASDLKETIAKWYYIIRNIAILGLMLVLIYVGIKILTSSIAADKAKYKQMISDWVIALCLIFLMQYIMVFANSFVDSVTNVFSNLVEKNKQFHVITQAKEELANGIGEVDENYVVAESDGTYTITWPVNLMGKMRIEAQEHDGTSEYVGYTICYMVLVMFTIFFSFTYAKRLLYLLFLTIIAPFVALTYPLDKIRDGQAQAFNMWMKEYIINLIIQPFHLLLYTIFVSMAFDLAGTNIIYSLVVIGFMMPAEKFLRSMFGFNKATTPGFLGGAAGAALTLSAMKSLGNFAGRGPGGKGKDGKGSGESGGSKNNKIRSADSGYTTDKLMGEVVKEGKNKDTDEDGGVSARQRMLEADDEKFGTDEYNHAERDALARDAGLEEGMNYTDEEYADILRDSGYSEEEIADMVKERNGENEEQAQISENVQEDNSEGLPEDMIEEGGTEQQNPGEEQIEQQEQQKDNKFKRTVSETGDYLKARFSNAIEDNFTAEKFKGLALKGARGAVKLGMGATGAAIGIAAGIASGSPSDTFKYGTAGAYAGSSIGQGLANRAGAATEREKALHEEALRKQYGDSAYQKKKKDELDEQFKKSAEARKKYALAFNLKTKEQIDKVMEQAVEYRRWGVSDDDTIINAMALNEKNRIDTQSIAAAKLSLISKSEKDLKTTLERFAKAKATPDQVKEMEKKIREINKSLLN